MCANNEAGLLERIRHYSCLNIVRVYMRMLYHCFDFDFVYGSSAMKIAFVIFDGRKVGIFRSKLDRLEVIC